MNRLFARLGVLALPALLATQVWAQQPQSQSAPASRVEQAAHKEPVPASKPAAAHRAAKARRIAPATPHALFGVFPIATRSDEARKLVEKSIDEYENVLLDNSVASAKQATVRDPKFALAYAVWGYAANRAAARSRGRQARTRAVANRDSRRATARNLAARRAGSKQSCRYQRDERFARPIPSRQARALPDRRVALFPAGLRALQEMDGAHSGHRSEFSAGFEYARLFVCGNRRSRTREGCQIS